MPIVRVITVPLNEDERPRTDKSFVTVAEWDNLVSSYLKQGAKRSHAGKVLTLTGKLSIIIVQKLID